MEQTLVVIKPDAVCRGLTGEILARFERAGVKIVGAKMVSVTKELADKHYPVAREEFIRGMGQKTIDNCVALGIDVKAEYGTDDSLVLGKMIREWLVEMITAGPVVALVLQSPHVVELVRKICGHTLPFSAAPGTIRGDYSFDSSYLANSGKRAIKNLLHASGTVEEAKYEIPLWFSSEEIHDYKRTDEEAMA